MKWSACGDELIMCDHKTTHPQQLLDLPSSSSPTFTRFLLSFISSSSGISRLITMCTIFGPWRLNLFSVHMRKPTFVLRRKMGWEIPLSCSLSCNSRPMEISLMLAGLPGFSSQSKALHIST